MRRALGDPVARVTGWTTTPVPYAFLNPTSGGVYRFAGTADGSGGTAAWRLVLKVTRSAETLEHESPLPPGLADAVRWDRELLAYESGFLPGLDGRLAAARSFGSVRNEDETGWLWLEDLAGAEGGFWPAARYEWVGRALGAFNGRFLAGDAAPADEWLGRGWLRTWVTQVTPFSFGSFLDPSAWLSPRILEAYPPAVRTRVLALWADRGRLLDAADALPLTCSHLDAHRRNLFERDGRVVAIDWGLLGLAPPGEEIASTLVGTVASGEVPVDECEPLASILYESYLAGLGEAGWRGDERDVRIGFTVGAALRTFAVLGLDADDAQLDRCTQLVRVLLDLGDEARRLIDARTS